MDKENKRKKKDDYNNLTVDDLLKEIENNSKKDDYHSLGSENNFVTGIQEEEKENTSAVDIPKEDKPVVKKIQKLEKENPKEKADKKKSVLRRILDEDPQEIVNERSEKAEKDNTANSSKRKIYAVFGLIFAVFACIGITASVSKGTSYFNSFTSGESKKDGFSDIIYPAVIMDIEPFEDVSQLSSEQALTCALWSMIMTDGALDKYAKTFDVATVPATDVEAYAVKIFGTGLTEFNHTNLGYAESRFYYNDTTKSYNVSVKPVVFTYEPEIKSVSRDNNIYTLEVDYIAELPAWMEKTVSKTMEYTLTDTNEGYLITCVKVLYENDSMQ